MHYTFLFYFIFFLVPYASRVINKTTWLNAHSCKVLSMPLAALKYTYLLIFHSLFFFQLSEKKYKTKPSLALKLKFQLIICKLGLHNLWIFFSTSQNWWTMTPHHDFPLVWKKHSCSKSPQFCSFFFEKKKAFWLDNTSSTVLER